MSTSVFTNGMWSPPAASPVSSYGPALALAAELPPLLLQIVGDHDEHAERSAEQDRRDDVADLEQPEPAVLAEDVMEQAGGTQLGGAPPEGLVGEVEPERRDDHDQGDADEPEHERPHNGLRPGPFVVPGELLQLWHPRKPEEQRTHDDGGDPRRGEEDEHREIRRQRGDQPKGHRPASGRVS